MNWQKAERWKKFYEPRNMTDRPNIQPNLTATDTLLEIGGGLALVAIWLLIVLHYTELPNIIPIHYNAAGDADAFGAKTNILVLPIIASLLYFGLTALNKYPYIFNYPAAITKENALKQYTYATRLIRFLKLAIVFIFGCIVWTTIHYDTKNGNTLESWFLPVAVGLLFLPLMFYILKAVKK